MGDSEGPQAPEEPAGSSPVWKQILGWLETIAKFLVLPTFASLVFGTLYWYIGEKPLHLVVWQPDNAIQVYPTDKVRDRLPIKACDVEVDRLSVIDVEVVNEGTNAIGTPSELWTVSLVVPNAKCIVTVRKIEASSPALVLMPENSMDPRRVSLRLGVFESRASVKTRLLVVNDKDSFSPKLEVDTPSLPGLPRQVITHSRIEHRAERLWVPILGFVSLLGIGQFAIGFYKEIRATPTEVRSTWNWKVRARKFLNIIGSIVGIVLLSGFAAYLIAMPLSWVLVWLR